MGESRGGYPGGIHQKLTSRKSAINARSVYYKREVAQRPMDLTAV